MSKSEDTAREPSDDDLRLVDLLYGELDADEADRARAELGEDAAGELAALEGLRSLFAELPAEDPPQAVSARLLHAAAEAAPSRGAAQTAAAAAAGGGFFARLFEFFRPLVANPALAAATMLVLVGGVVGALYLTGNFETTERQIAAGDHAPAASAPPALQAGDNAEAEETATPPSTGSGRSAGGEGRAATLATDEEAADLGIAEPAAAEDPNQPARGRIATGSASRQQAPKLDMKSGGKNGFEDGVYDKRVKKEAEKLPPPPPAERKPTTRATSSTSSTSTGKDKAKAPAKPGGVTAGAGDSPLIDAEDIAPEAPADQPEPAPAQEKARDQDESQSVRVQVADLHQRAAQAAADRECEAVQSLGDRIRKLDANYYTRSFRTDKRLAACLAAQTKPKATKK